MPDFITLTCPTCGGKLQITNSIDRFACGHCGNEHIVHREGGIVYLAPLVEGIQQIRSGVDKTAAELAVARLTKEIDDLQGSIEQIEETAYADLDRRLRKLRGPLFVGVSLVAVMMGAGIDSIGAGGGLLLGLVLAGVVYWTLKGYYKADVRSRLDAQIEPLENRVANRHSLLAKNRQIAES